MNVSNAPSLKQELIGYLRRNSQYENSFDENAVIRDVYAAPELTERQHGLLHRLYDAARYENNLDEEWAFRQVLKMPNISENQVRVVDTITQNARYNNDFDENKAVFQVLTHSIGDNQARVLSTIAREARQENDFSEDWAFEQVARVGELSSAKAAELVDIFRNARYENGLDDNNCFFLALTH